MVATAANIKAVVRVEGGKFVSPAVGTVGTVSISNSLAMDSGKLGVCVNKSLAQSNSVYLVASNLTATGGTIELVNYGPAYAIGDRFYLFANADGTHRALSDAVMVTVQGPGVTSWDTSQLGVNGSVAVQSVVAPSTEQITAAKSGASFNLSWPAAWLGVHLQSQTNTLATGLGTNWVNIAGSDAGNSFNAPLVNTNVFYRLAP
jgi:hypothetical protein